MEQQQVKRSRRRRPNAVTEQGADVEPQQQVKRSRRRRPVAITEQGKDADMEPQQQEMAPHCVKHAKQSRKTIDHSNVILALYAPSPINAFPPNEIVETDKNTTDGRSSSVDISNGPNNEHPVQRDQKGIIQQQNFSNTGDYIVKDRSSDATEPKDVINEQYIPNEEAVQLQNPANAEDILQVDPTVQQPINDINNEQLIIEEQAVVENQQDVAVNQQHLPDEQAGIMQEQNIQNAIEENVPEDPAVFDDIFNFPLNNELVDLGEAKGILEDPTGAENEQNIINNQQHIPDQQAGIVQQNPAENAIEVDAEDDPTVFGDIFGFPLNNQFMDLD